MSEQEVLNRVRRTIWNAFPLSQAADIIEAIEREFTKVSSPSGPDGRGEFNAEVNQNGGYQ
jgi:hypothetical protein